MMHVRNLSVTIKKRRLLDQISFDLERGRLLAIIGPNGAGKSTLLKAMTREVDFSGTVHFKGKVLQDWDPKKLARACAKFSQHHPQDIPLSVKEVVMMGRYPYFRSVPQKNDLQAVSESLQLTEMSVFRNRMYNHLSGGEKQRIQLSRIFAQLENGQSDNLMLLDEPLNNLDVSYQHKILKQVKSFIKKGNAGIVVLHDLNLAAQFADDILLLKDGLPYKYGDPSEVLKPETIFEVYNFPCKVLTHPWAETPMIVFGEEKIYN